MWDVNIATGELSRFASDFYLAGLMPFHWVRTYSSTASRSAGVLGFGWRPGADCELRFIENRCEYTDENSATILFPLNAQHGPSQSETGGLTLDQSDSGFRI